MIREILPYCGGQSSERAVGMYRTWHCFDCGLEFSLKSRQPPALCPNCKVVYDALPLDILPARGTFLINITVREAFALLQGSTCQFEVTIELDGWALRRVA